MNTACNRPEFYNPSGLDPNVNYWKDSAACEVKDEVENLLSNLDCEDCISCESCGTIMAGSLDPNDILGPAGQGDCAVGLHQRHARLHHSL